jgi:serine/threonine-protein kinase
VLAAEARGLLARLGFTDRPLDRAYGFRIDSDWMSGEMSKPADQRSLDRSTLQPAPIHFWYRESPRYLAATQPAGRVTASEPPVQTSGMANVVLDARGLLLDLLVIPPEVDETEPPWPDPDWEPLLEQAGFSSETLEPALPLWNPLIDVDRRAAWEGTYTGKDTAPLHIEAAAYHGTPVFFRVVPPGTRPARMVATRGPDPVRIPKLIGLVFNVVVLIGGLLLARRNLRLGRGDRKGAFRLAVVFFGASALQRVLEWHLVPDASYMLWLERTVADCLYIAAVTGLVYLAIEPYVRRIWPDLLISWGRLLEGRLRDPQIGRDILVGGGAGVLGAALMAIPPDLLGWADYPRALAGPLNAAHTLLRLTFEQGTGPLFALALLLLLTIVLRRRWIAVLVLFLMFSAFGGIGPGTGIALIVGAGSAAIMVFVLVRFGLLASIIQTIFFLLLLMVPIVLDRSAWYFTNSVLFVLAPAVLAVYGFYISLAGRRVFSDRLLGAEFGGDR